MRNLKRQKGLTLVEILIYFGLLTIFLLVSSQFFVSSANFIIESQEKNFVDLDSRLILSRLRYDLLRADSVSVPAVPGSSSPFLELMIDDKNFSYSLDNNSLTLSESGSNFAVHSNQTQVVNLSFQRLGNVGGLPTIKFVFTIKAVSGEFSEKSVRSTISLRY